MKRKLLDEFLKSDFSEIQLPEELSTTFNIIERIGFNEFGETFILSDKNTKEQYVLKMQDCSDVVNGNEKQLLYGLKHIGLPQYKNIIEQNNKQYSIYKYVEGEPLDEYLIDMSSVDTKQVVDNILSLCDVLKYLHSQPEPIIHRDIKPSNIIINIENNSITLIDFGIARKYQENAEMDTTYFGTHKFAPPEQYGFAQTDCRTDIYSLGVVMRYWLTGSTDGKKKILDKKLERIVAKCTALAPESRYQNITELHKALTRYKNNTNFNLAVIAGGIVAIATLWALVLFMVMLSNDIEQPDTPLFHTPVGYDDNEYQQLVSFFLYEDNLAKIQEQHIGFNIENPATWFWERGGTYIADDGSEHPLTNFIAWRDKRVNYIHLTNIGFTGVLDVSNFEQLIVLDVAQNNLVDIKLHGCISLQDLRVDRDILAILDLSELPSLEFIN
ncbi:MAG: protein kinase [Oscillospiraceae bacterium]|jgi:hypothetical protein|nr:protein kinase [Oscillospiraceae bacterium]